VGPLKFGGHIVNQWYNIIYKNQMFCSFNIYTKRHFKLCHMLLCSRTLARGWHPLRRSGNPVRRPSSVARPWLSTPGTNHRIWLQRGRRWRRTRRWMIMAFSPPSNICEGVCVGASKSHQQSPLTLVIQLARSGGGATLNIHCAHTKVESFSKKNNFQAWSIYETGLGSVYYIVLHYKRPSTRVRFCVQFLVWFHSRFAYKPDMGPIHDLTYITMVCLQISTK
jgi:hypothetical protein